MSEHRIQNEIRNALAGHCLLFRVNVGQAWAGQVQRGPGAVVLGARDVVIREARPFNTGLPPGFSDTFGGVPLVITPDMVGRKVLQFLAGEVKDEGGRVSPKQAAFLQAINMHGGRAGVWRSVDDALAMVLGDKGTT